MTPTERLEQALRATDCAGNDHDYICYCRPVDVRRMLAEVDQLRAALAANICPECQAMDEADAFGEEEKESDG